MEKEQLGTTRTEQDAIVNAANDCSIIGITGWRTDVPGGRVITVQIDEHVLYTTAYSFTAAILAMRLHRVKRIPDARLSDEIRDHASAMATQFVRCCYQQLRESAKVRYSTIVRDQMLLDLRLQRCNMPNVFARMIAGLGPITISEGHLKTTHLVPYLAPGIGDMEHDTTDQDHPWNEDIPQFMTCLASFRINPEIRVSDVDFTGTQGSAFWTVWAATPENLDKATGYCPLPESYYSEVDKLLASILKEPLFTWPHTPIVPIDWSDDEVERPAEWITYGPGTTLYGVTVLTANLQFTGPRHFYMPAELICARVFKRKDHRLRVIRPSPKSKTAPVSKGTRNQLKGKSAKDVVNTSNVDDIIVDTEDEEIHDEEISTAAKGATSKASKAPQQQQQQQEEPAQTVLQAVHVYRVRVGYAGFQGIAYEGVTSSVATMCLHKAQNLA